ncbi:MAG: NAD(P)/FAD-dependent oxidoreductase [Spirochaetaceae bacterium]|nr:MAG: NAD(P)/FAD-dependent oxidoreductase [Spirochaetaceae bacterium]
MQKVVIIGGGIGGLSAGIYAQRNGFESVILEKHHTPGGQCTGWDRKGYHIDGCIHWLTGTKEGSELRALWEEVGALDGVEIIHPESFLCFEHEGERAFIYRDLDKLQASWTDLSPQDAESIREFCDDVRLLQSFSFPVEKPRDLMSLPEKIRMLLSMKDAGAILKKYGKMTLTEFAERFSHPAIREGLSDMAPDNFNAAMIFFAIAAFTTDEASIPKGGSKSLALRMAERYTELGGVLETSCEVQELLIDGKHVRGVVCTDGRRFEPDYVIAACDAHFVYHNLLKGRYPEAAFEKRFNNPVEYPLASEILVALGYEGSVSGSVVRNAGGAFSGDAGGKAGSIGEALPWSLNYSTDPISINGREITRLTMKHFSHEPGFAPEGQTLLIYDISQFFEDFEAWDRLARDPEAYKQEKARIGQAVLRATEKRFPAMQGKLTVLDVVTPKTYERYCNAYRGAFMAFFPTVQGKMMEHSGRIRGLKNMVLSGQWVQPPGGLPTALLSGRAAIMRLCV